jgi:hypothetical protein
MKSSIEVYIDWLNALANKEAEYHKITEERERPAIWSLIYRNSPEPGSLLAFTYGLSSVEYRSWTLGRPELVVCVESQDINWGLAVAFLAKSFRGKSPFSYGTIHRFGERISSDSDMTAFVVFATSVLEPAEGHIELPDRTINLVQMYPIYEDEIELIKSKGVDRWVDRVDNIYDPRRKSVRTMY